jgi:endonuclease-3
MAARSHGKRPSSKDKVRITEILDRLDRLYPDAHCELVHWQTPLQLLVSVILSAQCTDARVNMVTPALFRRYPDARAFATAEAAELEELIRSTGFYRNKAKNIRAACKVIVEKHGGEVPRSLDALIELPGVARKTANVVLGTAYGIISGVVVDTHIGRLSKRLGMTREDDPEKIEKDLMALWPEDRWIMSGHRLIWHGRRVCNARKPNCAGCDLASLCPAADVTDEART